MPPAEEDEEALEKDVGPVAHPLLSREHPGEELVKDEQWDREEQTVAGGTGVSQVGGSHGKNLRTNGVGCVGPESASAGGSP
jgi:hypothetical protein